MKGNWHKNGAHVIRMNVHIMSDDPASCHFAMKVYFVINTALDRPRLLVFHFKSPKGDIDERVHWDCVKTFRGFSCRPCRRCLVCIDRVQIENY